jgi:Zn-dependent protease with chaperone function
LRARAACRGAGLVTLTGGLLVFLLLLFFAVQLTINLYSRSQVTAAGFDAARHVAGYDNDQRREAATVEAETRLRSMLGSIGDDVRVEWDLSDPDTVRLHLMLAPPSVAPALVRGAVGLDQIDRTIVVRVERPR